MPFATRRVYQKAYLEFFVAPDAFEADVLPRLQAAGAGVSYLAANATGGVQHGNLAKDAVSAVSWGVFPGVAVVEGVYLCLTTYAADVKAWWQETPAGQARRAHAGLPQLAAGSQPDALTCSCSCLRWEMSFTHDHSLQSKATRHDPLLPELGWLCCCAALHSNVKAMHGQLGHCVDANHLSHIHVQPVGVVRVSEAAAATAQHK